MAYTTTRYSVHVPVKHCLLTNDKTLIGQDTILKYNWPFFFIFRKTSASNGLLHTKSGGLWRGRREKKKHTESKCSRSRDRRRGDVGYLFTVSFSLFQLEAFDLCWPPSFPLHHWSPKKMLSFLFLELNFFFVTVFKHVKRAT